MEIRPVESAFRLFTPDELDQDIRDIDAEIKANPAAAAILEKLKETLLLAKDTQINPRNAKTNWEIIDALNQEIQSMLNANPHLLDGFNFSRPRW
ncbi:MAG: hypothetical protein JSR58_03620 [Verrucomicrobia bacterium]|nr:hypothetical protein [Verrucomicrobiota bacterium]